MLKKLLLLSLCCLSCPAIADRFYAGPLIGYGNLKMNYDGQPLVGINIVNDASATAKGTLGGLIVGYTHAMGNNFVGSIEFKVLTYALGTLNNVIQTQNGPILTTAQFQQKLQYSYGLSLKPGYYVLNNTLLYANFGYLLNRFNGQFSLNFSDGEPTLLGTYHPHTNSFEYGVGIEQSLNQHMGVRLEYDHQSYSLESFNNFPDGNFSAQFAPTSNQVSLAAVYTFGNNFIEG